MVEDRVKKIYVTQKLPGEAMEKLRSNFSIELWQKETPPSKEVIGKKIQDIDGLCCTLNDRIDKEVIDNASEQFRIIAQVAVGYDNVDLEAATKKGIYVTNTPGVLTETTADFAFGLLFAVARRMVEADKYVRRGDWRIPWGLDMILGQDVWGKVIGIVGLGRIGTAVAHRAKGMHMKILYYDNNRNVELEKILGMEYVNLDKLLRISDFISLHVPLLPTTHHLIDENKFKIMKKTACLINTSRGKVVDEKALYRALKERWIWGAGIDVWESEPMEKDNPLLRLNNLVASPHISSASVQTRTRMALMAVDNIIDTFKGRKPANLVNTQVLDIKPPHLDQ